MSIEDLLPKANFPKESGMYRFAELIVYDIPILKFAEYENNLTEHYFDNWTPKLIFNIAEILNETCPLMEFDHGVLGKHMIPTPNSNWYSLIGVGYAEIDVENKLVKRFLGQSCVYPGIDYDFLEVMRPLVLPWKFP